jgi:hypothetical protein
MFVMDGFVCGGEPTETIKITSVKALEECMVLTI